MNSADQWFIEQVLKEIQKLAGVDGETAERYMQDFDFKGYLRQNSWYVYREDHHCYAS